MWASAYSVFVLAPLSAAKSKCDGAQLFVIHLSTHVSVPYFQWDIWKEEGLTLAHCQKLKQSC
jgi:hypothetical protein